MSKSKKMDLLTSTTNILQNVKEFLRQVPPATYIQPSESLSGSTIGQHIRHALEFYQCLISQCPESTINYDLRQRNLDIETDPDYAATTIDAIMVQLSSFELDHDLLLVSGIHEAGVPTNFGRELLYNLEHMIHHLAIIRIAVLDLSPDLRLSDQFGVAPSTLRHRDMQMVK